MVEQQHFAGTDNTAQQTHTAGDAGLNGQNRMELYQDFNKTVGQGSAHEKSQSEQGLKDGKSDKEFPKFDDIYAKTTSGGGTNGERSLNSNQQGDKDKPQQGTEKPQDGSTQQRNESQEPRQPGSENPQERSQSETDAQKGSGSEKPNSPRDFNGRQDPYTKEALEGKAGTDSPDGKAESRGNAGEKKSEGEKPGAPRHEPQSEPVNKDGTPNGANELEGGQGDAQRQGNEGREGGDSAQRQGNSDAQRQSSGTDKPLTRGLNADSRQDGQRSDSQGNISDLSKQNAQQMMSAEETVDDNDAQDGKPGSPNQRSEQNERADQNQRSDRNENSNRRSDARDNVEAELSKRQGNTLSASETVEESDKPGSPDQKVPGKDGVNGGRPNSPDQRFDPRNDLSHLSRQNAEQMMTGKETVEESDKPNSPDQRSDAQSGRANSRNSLSDLSRQNAEQMMTGKETVEESDKPNSPDQRLDAQDGRAGNEADSQRQRSTRGINVESSDAASPERRQEDQGESGTRQSPNGPSGRGGAVVIERGKVDAEPTVAPNTVHKDFESGTRQSAYENGPNASFFSKDDNARLSVDSQRQAKQAKGFVHAGPPQQKDHPDSPRGPKFKTR